jgi:hypothetical protein
MAISPYTLTNQVRVLKEVNAQCGPYGNTSVTLSVDGLTSEEISKYCFLLSELDWIKVNTLQDPDYDRHYPIRITAQGLKYLSDQDKSFWDYAKKAAGGMVEHFIGFDIEPIVDFLEKARSVDSGQRRRECGD